MSEILLADAKAFLNVIHAQDDAKLQLLLNAAEAEALNFIDRTSFTGPCEVVSSEVVSSEPAVPDDIKVAVFMLLQGSYEATPAEAKELRELAEVKLMPHRCGLGI